MELKLWVEFFDDLQHVRGRSLNTVMAYRHDLELYRDYSKASSGISGFYEYMKSHDLSQRSQARVISSLRTYFKFCESQGQLCPELRDLRPPKIKVGLPKALTLDEFHRLFQAAETLEPAKTVRNRISLLLLFGLGCRVSELVSLNLHDFNETDQWVKILGKGSKERLVPLTQALAAELKAYLENSRSELVKESTPSLLINDRGHRPSRVDIWRWLSSWSLKAGFDEPVSPHRFRHGCATALLDSGADLRSIQLLLGHSSIQTTQIYTSVSTKNISDAIDKHHPLSRVEDLDQI